MVAQAGQPDEPAHRRDLDEPSPNFARVHVAEECDRGARDVYSAPEVCVEHRARVRLARGLDFAESTPRRVVHDDVEPAERGIDLRERLGDLVGVADVELEYEETIGGVLRLQVVERAGAAGGGDDDLALCEDELGERAS